jgi:DNA invertase Pin-like site-specific DNA recombinase
MKMKVNKEGKTMTDKKQAANYIRVAHFSQVKDPSPLDMQQECCIAHAKERDYQVNKDHTYQDIASWNSLTERPGLAALREVAHAGAFQIVIVHDLSRITRDPILLFNFEQEMQQVGVTIEYVVKDAYQHSQALQQSMQTAYTYIEKQVAYMRRTRNDKKPRDL